MAVRVKVATRLEAKGTIGAIGDTRTLKATLTVKSTKKPIANRRLSFKVGNKSLGTAKTNSKGQATIKYEVPNRMGAKKIAVAFAGDKAFLPSSDTANFGTIKSSTRLSADGGSAKPGRIAHFHGKLTRITDKLGLSGREVVVERGNKIIARASTRKSGRFQVGVPVSSAARQPFQVTVRFNGDGLYASSAATTTVDVQGPKPKIYLSWGNASGRVGTRATVRAYVSRSRFWTPDRGIGNLKVRLWRVRSKRWYPPHYPVKQLCEARTDGRGVATLRFTIDDDAYGYTLEAHVDQKHPFKYELVKLSDRRLQVHKSPVAISVNCGLTKARIGARLACTVLVKRSTDGRGLPNMYVRLGTQRKKTSSIGSVVFLHTIANTGALGLRQIRATTAETKRYSKGMGYATIQVLPAVD